LYTFFEALEKVTKFTSVRVFTDFLLSLKCTRVFGRVEVPNRKQVSCSYSSLLECSPAMQAIRVQFPAKTCLSRGALVEDEDGLGQDSLQWQLLKICLF
jgi:hypothetical protein